MPAAAPRTRAYDELERLRRLVLDPDETFRTDFPEYIRLALATVPAPGGSARLHIGGAVPDLSTLADTEVLPQAGADPGQALTTGMGALQGLIRWHATTAMHNVNPPVLVNAAAAYATTALFNPNALWDLVSGGVLDVERQIVRQLGVLMGWQPDAVDGLFTFGGKAGLIYGIRLGLGRCLPGSAQAGLASSPLPAVLTTDQNHYSISTACALLGLGRDAVVEAATTAGRMDIGALRRAVEELIAAGRPIACVVACGGNTLDAVVDPLVEIADLLDGLVADGRLGYRPWIHFDLPLGWPWLFFHDYDFDDDPLELPAPGVAAARQVVEGMAAVARADSTCFDLHKLGFVPHACSVFMTRWWRDLRMVFGDAEPSGQWLGHGENFRQHHSIEHSRSGAPIVAAWVALQTVGADGFRAYLAHLHHMTSYVRGRLAHQGMFVLNAASPSLATMFVPPRPGGLLRPSSGSRKPLLGLETLDAEEARAQDRYTERFFRCTAGLSGTTTSMAIGFVPNYTPPGSLRGCSALRIYLANPAIDRQTLRSVVADLVRLKAELDVDADEHDPTPARRFVLTPK